jgi:hypothetical protein
MPDICTEPVEWEVVIEGATADVIVEHTVLEVVIETGVRGQAGAPGLVWRGAWAAGTYAVGDAVQHEGSAWIATAETTEEPGVGDEWDLLAQGGDGGGGSLPADAVRYEIDETETYVILKNAAGTPFARILYEPV